jgi:hypothetical protein
MVGWRVGAPPVIVGGMWPSLARARRLLGRAGAAEVVLEPGPSGLAGPMPSEIEAEVVVSLARSDVDRLGIALQALLGPSLTRPDTPARLEAALAAAVTELGGDGRPRVVRRPAGVTTPEAWQIRLSGVDPAITDQIRGATRGRPFTGTR